MLIPLAPYTLVALTPQDPDFNPEDPADVVQLQLDLLNVLEGRVSLGAFTPDYQNKLKNYYQFYGIRSSTKHTQYPKMIRETFEVV